MEHITSQLWIPGKGARVVAVFSALIEVGVSVKKLPTHAQTAYRDGVDEAVLIDRAKSYNWVVALENHGAYKASMPARRPGMGSHFAANMKLDFQWMLRPRQAQGDWIGSADAVVALANQFEEVFLSTLRLDAPQPAGGLILQTV